MAPLKAGGRVGPDARPGVVVTRIFGGGDEPPTIGRFALLDRLGEGGMGVVYAAYDEQLDRRIAVKVLGPWVVADRRGRSRLLREAKALARLSHPNIVRVHEVGEVGDDVFVAMEYVDGLSLDRWMEGPPEEGMGRPWRAVVEVFAAAGAGLAAAHEAGIVHRDFKPHNVIVADDGGVKVLDFGLARLPDSAPEGRPSGHRGQPPSVVTPPGAAVGTPAYMAPEQHRGESADASSDQFNFFASLYHALYRQLPFVMGSAARLREAVAEGRVRSIPSDSTVPSWLHRVLLVGLHPDPRQRFPSMKAALEAVTADPSRGRRRKVGLAAAMVAVAGLSAAVAVGSSAAAGAACEHGVRAMARQWGPASQDEVERGLADSGLPHADETWQRLLPRLDAYAAEWATTRDAACAEHRDGGPGARLYDRRVVCLEQREAAFGALVELLSTADRSTADRALSAAASLPTVASCRDAAVVLARVPPPDDPGLAFEVQAQRRVLARAQEHEALGQFEAGLRRARAAVRTARALAHPPLLAEALVRLGSLTMEHGAPADADQLLSEALTLAMASAHVEVATEAVARRIFVRAERMRSPDRAVDDVALGAGLVARDGVEDRLAALYLNNVGAYHIRREDHDAARQVLELALEIKRRTLGPKHPDIVLTLGNLAIVEQHAGRDERARARLDEAVRVAERVVGRHHATTAELARLRGQLLVDTGHLGAARQALLGVLDILSETTGNHSPLHHGPLVTLGEIALVERRYAQAQAWFERAAALNLTEDGGGQMYRVLEEVGLARAQLGLGHTKVGRATFERAVQRAHRDRAPYESMLHDLRGRTLSLHGWSQEALADFEAALRIDADNGNARSDTAASAWVGRGQALRRVGRPAQAEAALEQAQSILDQIGGPRRDARAEIRMERALVAADQGRDRDAIAHARAAAITLEPWGRPDHPQRLRAQSVLAVVLWNSGSTEAHRREAVTLAGRARAAWRARGVSFDHDLARLDEIKNSH
ncbi:MAG: serine/threonine-protein kinase [Deltaproteobacteria bacterium]|nr:serine/threonine-protein kinase [Deltaproteobacteria bacterium]